MNQNDEYLSRLGRQIPMRATAALILVLMALKCAAQSVTPPAPLQATKIYSVASNTIIDCGILVPACIDNRSQQYRRNTYNAYQATGTGRGRSISSTSTGHRQPRRAHGPVSARAGKSISRPPPPASATALLPRFYPAIHNRQRNREYVLCHQGRMVVAFRQRSCISYYSGAGRRSWVVYVEISSLYAGCSNAGPSGTLYVTLNWTALSTATYDCMMVFTSGSIQPASGNTLTLSSFSCPGTYQICFDPSAGGSFSFGNGPHQP